MRQNGKKYQRLEGPVNSNNKGADRRGQGLSQGRRQQDSKAGTTAPGARRLGSTTRQVRSFLKTFQAHLELACGKRNQGGPPASAERREGAANQVPLTVSTSNLHHQQVQHHPLTQNSVTAISFHLTEDYLVWDSDFNISNCIFGWAAIKLKPGFNF